MCFIFEYYIATIMKYIMANNFGRYTSYLKG